MTNTINHWVNNEAFAGSGGSQPVTNPATGQVTAPAGALPPGRGG